MKLTDQKLTKIFFSSEIRIGPDTAPTTRQRFLNKLRKTKARDKPEMDPDLPDLEPEGTLH